MRRSHAAVCFVLGFLALLPSRSTATSHAHRHDDPSLVAIEAALQDGAIDTDAALMLTLQRVFEPESLPAAYRADDAPPLRCATPIVQAARGADLSPTDRARVDAWLSAPTAGLARRIAYTTPAGRFELDYVTSGSDAVPLEDIAPANGIPDYVERVGSYFEESWQREFVDLGFAAPDLSGGPYRVFLRRIGAYGFTAPSSEGTAGTEITVHHTFLNFPPNDDPDGNQWGAAKVTAAHELKHASQWTNNGWSESGLWIEIDATWMEDIVYDQVNDFYNYITFRSPISDPPRPLDDGGSGAYAEAIWQHWISETWGIEAILAFWDRRAALPGEGVMQSYAATIAQFGPPLVDAWADFVTWNQASGANLIGGFGYEEALGFPTPPTTAEATALPANFSGTVARLAANFLRVTGFSDAEPGVVTLTPQIPTSSPLRARVVITQRDGARSVVPITLENGVTVELLTPLVDVAEITLVLGHGSLTQGPAVYQVEVAQEIRRPRAIPLFGDDAVRARVSSGDTTSRAISLENVGASGSLLDFEAVVVPSSVPAPARSISGSGLAIDRSVYEPASTATLLIEVANRSIDFEWLRSVAIDFPPGVTVIQADDFLAPEDRRLVNDGTTGDGVTVTWTDPDGAWGNVRNGETAVAKIEVAFALQLHGDLVVPYTLVGDGFGTGESIVESALLLTGPASPLIEVAVPDRVLKTGELASVTWTAAVEGDVGIDVSRDDGATWDVLVDATENDGVYSWLVAGPTTFEARLRVRNAADSAEFGVTVPCFVIAETVPWAQIVVPSGTIPAGGSSSLEVAFDASALSEGTYTAQLALVYEGMSAPALIPVELIVSLDGTSTQVPSARGVVHGARPNPFNPATHVEFTLNRASHVRVDVYDIVGRHVRSVLDAPLSAGDHAARWDGVDAQGRRVASGVYLYVVDLQGERVYGKVGLVK